VFKVQSSEQFVHVIMITAVVSITMYNNFRGRKWEISSKVRWEWE